MSLVAAATSLTVLMLLASVVLAWVGDLRRTGGAVSARESQIAAEKAARGGRATFYTSREDRAEAMRERIQRERRRRERARASAGQRVRQRAAPEPDRPPALPPEPDDVRHRATLELGPGPVTESALRASYRRLVVAYHPDRVAGLGVKIQQLAEEETKAINEAYAFFKARLDG